MADEFESWPPLHRAARNGDVNEISDLIAQGADVKAVIANGITALYIAAQEGKTDVIEVLVKAPGIDLLQGNQGASPLHMAAQNSHVSAAEALLKAHADVNAATKRSGKTPLHFAALKTNEAMIDLLIKYGGRLDIRTITDPKKTPEEFAIEAGHPTIAMKLKINPYTVKTVNQGGVVQLDKLNQGATRSTPAANAGGDIDEKVKKFIDSVAGVPGALDNFKGLKWKQFRAMSKQQILQNGVKEEDANKIMKGFEKLDKKAAQKKPRDKPTTGRTTGEDK